MFVINLWTYTNILSKYTVNKCGDITKEYLYFIALTVLLKRVFVFHFILQILTFNVLIILISN